MIQTYVTEEREEELKQAVEAGNWNTLADYIRHMIRAGESNVAELDPRGSGHKPSQERVSDRVLVDELDNEFKDIDQIISNVVSDLEREVSQRLFEMAKDDEHPVVTDGRGNYRIDQ